MKITAALLSLLLIFAPNAEAAAFVHGTGIMYDKDYSFILTAPKGWILDNSAVKDKGVCAVFYPVNSSWKESAVVFYVNTREKTDKTTSARDAANNDIADLQANGSRGSRAQLVKEMRLKNGRMASIWEYTGDQWGNYERTAFIVEEKGISAIVLSARTKREMYGAIPAFETLVSSYEYMGPVKIEKGS